MNRVGLVGQPPDDMNSVPASFARSRVDVFHRLSTGSAQAMFPACSSASGHSFARKTQTDTFSLSANSWDSPGGATQIWCGLSSSTGGGRSENEAAGGELLAALKLKPLCEINAADHVL